MKKKLNAQKIRSKYYEKVIQINVPIRFYWNDGNFDGVEFGAFEKPISQYELKLIYEALDIIRQLMGTDEFIANEGSIAFETKTPIPEVFLRAFKQLKCDSDSFYNNDDWISGKLCL